ncbi:MAG: hypothetical protein K8H84_11260 [Sulfuricella denitrificans]|nr:hypothetical protein [Sulfuricella denitrificans]
MRAIEMSGKTRHQGLHQRGMTDKSVIRLGEDLISALSALDKAHKSLSQYVIKKADGHAQAPAMVVVNRIIVDAAKGLLQVSDRVMALDDVGRELCSKNADIHASFNALQANCSDLRKEKIS